MGFDENTDLQLNEQKAIIIIVIAAYAVGGECFSRAKMKGVSIICSRSPIFVANSSEETNAYIKFALNILSTLGERAIELAAEALPPKLRETAFALATEMILTEGFIDDDKERFLFNLLVTLQIKEDVAREILRVSVIRARGV